MTISETRILLGGSSVDLMEFGETLERISAHLASPQADPLAVTSVNLDHIHHFGTGSSGTLDSPGSAIGTGGLEWLNLIDGAPLAAQARRLTGHAWPRLAGSDLIGPILLAAEQNGTRVGFLGGTENTQQQLRSELALKQPLLRVSGYWSPPRDDLADQERSARIAGEIAEAGTDLLVVGLGKPRQELWIARHGAATGARVLLAFGAVVDFLAGRVSRAPRWVSEHGMEWAWRLALEPQRLASRYLIDGPPAYLAVRRTSESDARLWPAAAPDPHHRRAGSTGHTGAIIIPAHNEANVIAATLAPLAPLSARDGIQVIVVCNGCTDDTAAVARQFPGVTVCEISTAYKPAALNVGDRVATAWPRLYLDADVVIDPDAVTAVFEELTAGETLAAGPTFCYDTAGASALVRRYYRARNRIPRPPGAIWGAGAYAVNAAGHERFPAFPELTADDSYVDALFSPDEKRVLATAPVRVRTPLNTSGLLAVLTRQRRGVVQLGAGSATPNSTTTKSTKSTKSTTAERTRALIASVRGPSSALDAFCYLALTALGRLRSRRKARINGHHWETDRSSRAVRTGA